MGLVGHVPAHVGQQLAESCLKRVIFAGLRIRIEIHKIYIGIRPSIPGVVQVIPDTVSDCPGTNAPGIQTE